MENYQQLISDAVNNLNDEFDLKCMYDVICKHYNKADIEEKYSEWRKNITTEQFELQGLCYEYEDEYFEDMTLQKNSILYDVVQNQDEWTDGILMGIEFESLRFYIVNSDEYKGCFSPTERKIEIDRRYVNSKDVTLHELIHFYEWQLERNVSPTIRELLILRLYNKLKPQINNIDELITFHCDAFENYHTFYNGGQHGLLFYLKSLDLDLRCGYSLGTVCGYGRENLNK